VRVATATQDGRRLRRYRRLRKIERLFAWLHNFRRIVIRWEYYPENFLGMVQLAALSSSRGIYEMPRWLLVTGALPI
jgi:transposase